MKKMLMLAPLVAALLAAPALGSTPSWTTGESHSDVPMTQAQAAAYLESATSPAYRCATATDHHWLSIAGVGTHVADVWDSTRRCWWLKSHHIVSGSVEVFPSAHTAFTYDGSEKWWDLGYPFGYTYTRRNSCVHLHVEWAITHGLNAWNITAAEQVRGDGSVYFDTLCRGNIATGVY